MFARLLLDHPRAVGESYFEHQRHALGFAASLMLAGVACMIHALVPGLCVKTASRTVAKLQERIANRASASAFDPAAVPAE